MPPVEEAVPSMIEAVPSVDRRSKLAYRTSYSHRATTVGRDRPVRSKRSLRCSVVPKYGTSCDGALRGLQLPDELEDVVQVDEGSSVETHRPGVRPILRNGKQQLSRYMRRHLPRWAGRPRAPRGVEGLFFSTACSKKQRRLRGSRGHEARSRWRPTSRGSSTVARGRRELLMRDVELDGVRRKGGGRAPCKKKPEVIAKLEELIARHLPR